MIFGGKTAGYVTVTVKDGDISGLINILMARNVPVWQVRQSGDGVSFRIPLAALVKARKVAQSCGCYLTVTGRGGAPIFLKRMKKRSRLWFTVAVVFALLLLFSSSILRVEAVYEDGAAMDKTMSAEIMSIAADHGVHPLVLKYGVDYDAVGAAIMDRFPDISWVGFEVSGVTVRVKVAAKELEAEDNGAYGHIVAAKNGVVRQIFVLRGQKKVEIGETVEKGDILISGLITYEEEGKTPNSEVTGAKGMVTAAVWYEGVAYVSLSGVEVVPTGEAAGTVTVTKGDQTYLLWGSDVNPFEDSVTEVKRLTLPFGYSVAVKTFAAAEAKKTTLTAAEALTEAEKQAKAKAKAALPANAAIVEEKSEQLNDHSGAVGVRYIIETEEEIGTFVPMEQ